MSSTLRLKYVFLTGTLKSGSVEDKVFNQIRQLNEHGIEAQGLVFFSKEGKGPSGYDEKIYKPIALPEYTQQHRYYQSHYVRQSHFRFIADYLSSIEDEFDLIFLRHAGNGKDYETILERFASKTLLYVPSNRIREVYCERRYAKDSGIGSALFSWWGYFRFWLREKRIYRKYLTKLKAVVTFTPEFGDILAAQAGGNVRLIYNRDGTDTLSVPARSERKRTGTVKLIFLKGSGQEQKWAGLDRLISSIEAQPEIPFQLYITGNAINQPERYGRDFVTLTGRLPDKELEELIDEVDLGVSNLANYLIHFKETTNLKSRDYYSRGLPFIQSNTMPDVEGLPESKYYLHIPNDDTLIDMKAVHDFALGMREDTNHVQAMHDFAERQLDWNLTVSELAADIKKL